MELDQAKSRIIYSYVFCIVIAVLATDCPQNIVKGHLDT